MKPRILIVDAELWAHSVKGAGGGGSSASQNKKAVVKKGPSSLRWKTHCTSRLIAKVMIALVVALVLSPAAAQADCPSGDFAGCTARCVKRDGEACSSLGAIYRTGGYGVARNEARAVELYRRACNLGSAKGCTNLREMPITGLSYQGGGDEAARATLFISPGFCGRPARRTARPCKRRRVSARHQHTRAIERHLHRHGPQGWQPEHGCAGVVHHDPRP